MIEASPAIWYIRVDSLIVDARALPLTTKTHVSRILTKLDARGRAKLGVIAYESGLVTPGSTPTPA
jgi:hypothetical protein